MKQNGSIASLLSLLDHLAEQWSGRLTIISTIRFTESTYLKLRRRIDDWEWERRRAGLGILEITNGIIAQRMKAKQLSELGEAWESASGSDELAPNWKDLRKQQESRQTVMEAVEANIQETLDDGSSHESENPRGRYLVSAFQDPPEVERFFDVCLSVWTEPSAERTRPTLACVVKNRHEETTSRSWMTRSWWFNEILRRVSANTGFETSGSGQARTRGASAVVGRASAELIC